MVPQVFGVTEVRHNQVKPLNSRLSLPYSF